MAGKFVDLVDAAKMLGLSPEQLVELRSKGQIFGYRDGSSWKFKQEEVERVIAERNDDDSNEILSADDGDFERQITGLSSKILADRAADEQHESILISEDDLGGPPEKKKGPSTIIGRAGDDNDIQLGHESGPGHSDALAPSGLRLQTGSDILAGSAPRNASGSATGVMGGKPAASDDDELSLGSDSALSSSSDDDFALADDTFSLDDLTLGGSSIGGKSGKTGKQTNAKAPALDDDDDYSLSDDMSVLGDEPKVKGSGKGSDVTFGGGDSGINLSPSDAGLSLEEQPLDLGGSAVDPLELPDDDMISLTESADPDQATQLKADDQFLLSPSDALSEEESDSGSQVIALEESESFDNDANTMLGSGQPALVADDAFVPAGGMMAGMGPGMMSPGMQPGMAPVYMSGPAEAPYSIFNVLSLMLVAGLLALSGMVMVDVVNNMWSWQGVGSASTSTADLVISIFGLDK